jgi:hypothetical protein
VFLAFKYNPQALQMVSPLGALRQRGVVVVPQLEQTVAETVLSTGSVFTFFPAFDASVSFDFLPRIFSVSISALDVVVFVGRFSLKLELCAFGGNTAV